MGREKDRVANKKRLTIVRVLMVPVVLIPFVTWRRWNDNSLTDFVVEWTGYLFLLAGLGLRLWSSLYIGGRKSKEIVAEGPYSVCRNPLYLGTLLAAIGASLCLESLPMLAAILLAVIPAHLYVISAEEANLSEKFGASFEEYKRTVPKLWIAPSRYRSSEYVSVHVKDLRRAILEAAFFFMIPALGDLLETLHAHHLLPNLLGS